MVMIVNVAEADFCDSLKTAKVLEEIHSTPSMPLELLIVASLGSRVAPSLAETKTALVGRVFVNNTPRAALLALLELLKLTVMVN